MVNSCVYDRHNFCTNSRKKWSKTLYAMSKKPSKSSVKIFWREEHLCIMCVSFIHFFLPDLINRFSDSYISILESHMFHQNFLFKNFSSLVFNIFYTVWCKSCVFELCSFRVEKNPTNGSHIEEERKKERKKTYAKPR